MKLNRLEYALMNNPFRVAFQRGFEAPRLREMGGEIPGGNALEVGCGAGAGIPLIRDYFGASHVDALDFDARMIDRARKRHGAAPNVKLFTGDATRLPFAANRYDAVFDFGALHHVPAWRTALKEIHRVLKPGGRFYAHEALRPLLKNPLVRRLLVHPDDDRFDVVDFTSELHRSGFSDVRSRPFLNAFSYFVARKETGASPT